MRLREGAEAEAAEKLLRGSCRGEAAAGEPLRKSVGNRRLRLWEAGIGLFVPELCRQPLSFTAYRMPRASWACFRSSGSLCRSCARPARKLVGCGDLDFSTEIGHFFDSDLLASTSVGYSCSWLLRAGSIVLCGTDDCGAGAAPLHNRQHIGFHGCGAGASPFGLRLSARVRQLVCADPRASAHIRLLV